MIEGLIVLICTGYIIHFAVDIIFPVIAVFTWIKDAKEVKDKK